MQPNLDSARAAAPPDGPNHNLLGRETSPYLLQHAHNPVHWHPWGEAALAEAARLDRPILLSIGYAACHWCHVMAHESFEDGTTAAAMNSLFVNVKVDREERPDIDAIYQHALALMGEQGGWPLTMFLTPMGEPFWGGTYFPNVPRYGRPAFKDLIARVAAIYRDEKDSVAHNVSALKAGLARLNTGMDGDAVPLALLDRAAHTLLQHMDLRLGGTSGAPKFPQPALLKFFWRAWQRTGESPFRDAVTVTLTHMSQGGIYDHLGGGFARYSTDEAWLVPHFEKMLYDNAQLLDLLADAWLETKSALYAARARETVEWVLREMIAEGGAFAATQDADSEGEEGKFYVWTEAEIDRLLGADAALFKQTYDVSADGNWEGHTILRRSPAATLADPDSEAALARARKILWRERESRIKPGWDDKVLADWNGLMIAALARASLVFDEASWLDAARRAFAFVDGEMRRDGRLYHAFRAGQLKHPGTLDDYANMIDAALALFEATGEDAYLGRAREWVGAVERHFVDPDHGGYFFTADDVADVIVRTKTAADNATPAGNGVMIAALARLFFLTAEDSYRAHALAAIAAFSGQLRSNLFGLATYLNAVELLEAAIQVVLVGVPGEAGFESLRRAAYAVSAPNRIVALMRPDATLPAGHPAQGKLRPGAATAYVCRGPVCSLPIDDAAALRAELALSAPNPAPGRV
jgi:uncharacterized protein YyaL (SSP411 family)